MNHCVLEVEVIQAPTIRYTQDNQTPIAEMEVRFDALRVDDAPGQLKVVGWGNLAQDLQNRVQVGQRLVVEGRLRMNTVPRQDGTKEKRAEFTLARVHNLSAQAKPAAKTPDQPTSSGPNQASQPMAGKPQAKPQTAAEPQAASWNSAPLVPDTDDIPF
ncbi:MAG: single-stranded DNA-binding protein [Prochlorococcus sp.]|jgi:single-stranded DNA-binding protein|nr:single-stranded DNA-binding protein [Prochlorococcaceae cyanobacterium ETNP18_MAG_14]MDP6321952.1 single-stranded DNA-binding protein [Prochlorococcaceae cyanobacterium ETNP14_MAG_5]|tara:strand:+ start:1702 stop:2178 length:477 start_codon:yes stop_codon:yes gene_type:complete